MSTLQTLFRPALSAIAVAGALMAAAPASAEILRKDEMLRGVTMTQAQCAAIPQTVWVNAYGRDFCVRYYMSTAGGEGRRPVVFLQGDQFGWLDLKTLNWTDPSGAADVNTADLVSFADSFSKTTETTAIYLARIGVDGTSGDHRSRKTVLELKLMDAALDAIKRRHGFEGFHIFGQSGGSQILSGLIGLRKDIGCAVAGSGPAHVTETKADDPGRSYFGSFKFIPGVLRRPLLRLLVVTDQADRVVSAEIQTAYVQTFRNAGRPVPQLNVEATDPKHHDVIRYAALTMAGCVLGRSDAEIDRAIQTLVKRTLEFNAQKEREAQARARMDLASQRS